MWSLPAERRLPNALRERYGDYVVCPLAYDALWAAADLFPPDQQLDPYGRVAPADRERLDRESVVQANALYARLMERTEEPWLAGLPFYLINSLFYYRLYWRHLLDTLAGESAGRDRLALYAPFSRATVPPFQQLAVAALECEMARRGVVPWPDLFLAQDSWKQRLRARAGGWVNHHFDWYSHGAPVVGMPECSWLFCGLQETDRLVQADVVRRLAEEGWRDLAWVVPASSRLKVAQDEQALGGSDSAVVGLRHSYELHAGPSWTQTRWTEWSQSHIVGRLADLLGGVVEKGAERRECRLLAARMVLAAGDIRQHFARVHHLLSALNPQTIVINSSIEDMVPVKRWARWKKRRLVRLPHGVELGFREDYIWDADHVGVFGEHYRQALSRAQPALASRLFTTGSLHLGAQAGAAAPSGPDVEGVRRLTLVVTPSRIDNYPDTTVETRDDLLQIARVVQAWGGSFRIRSHPRASDEAVHDHTAQRAQQDGLPVERSSGRSSLLADLQQSSATLVRIWGGAAVQALYARCPLIGWNPRPGLPESAELLSRLPLCARDAESLLLLLRRLSDDPAFRRHVLEAQEAFLAEHIQDPRGDPVQRTVDQLNQLRS
jgi:hypothetical protein